MKTMRKRFISILLSMSLMLGLLMGMHVVAEAAGIGVGTTWYIGDTINLNGKWFQPSDTSKDKYLGLNKTNTVPEPTFTGEDFYNAWRFWMTINGHDPSEPENINDYQVWCTRPSSKPSSEMPVGFKIKGGNGTESNPYTFELAYREPVTGVSLDHSSVNVNPGGIQKLTASITPANATDKKVKWSIGGSNTNAIKLYSDSACQTEVGTAATSTLVVYAKGISAGSAVVTATSNDNSTKKATCTIKVHQHSFTYSASGAAISATCHDTSAHAKDYVVTMTLNAPALKTYGGTESAAAAITGLDAFNTATGLSVKTDSVKYYKATKNGDTYTKGDELPSAPSDAGDYLAEITAGTGSNTASVGYTIAKAQLADVSVSQSGKLTYTGYPQTPQVNASAVAAKDQTVTFTYSKTEDGTYGDMPTVTNVSDSGTFYFKATAPNHEDAAGTFTVTMNKAEQTITAEDVTVTYGDTEKSVSAATDGDGAISYSVKSGSEDYIEVNPNTGALTIKKAGTAYVIAAAAETDSYLQAAKDVTVTINKAEINNVTVNIDGWTYGDDAKNPEAESDFGTPVFTYSNEEEGTYSSEVPVHAGTWYVKAEVEGTDNYAGGSAVKSFVIAKKTLNIRAEAKSKIYGEPDPALTYTSEGLVGSDEITGALERAEGNNAGTYEISKGTVTASDDYTVNYSPALFTIEKADSDTTSPEANELTYNGAEQELVKAGTPTGGTLVYSLDGENYDSAIPVAKDAGQYTVSYKVEGDKNHNDTEPAQITVTILKKDLTVTADAQNKIYGEDDPELTYAYEGLEDGDSFTDALAREEGEDVGTYPILIGTLSAGSNYNILFTGANLTIEKAESAVTAAPEAKKDLIYSGKAQELITAGTSEGGEMQYALGTDAAEEPEGSAYAAAIPTAAEAGTYNVWYKVAGDSNHNDTAPESLEVTIAKKSVTAPEVNSKVYTGALQKADTASTDTYTVKTNNGGVNVGAYDVVLELKDSSNYKWSDSNDKAKTLKFAITKATSNKVTVNISGWTYGSAAKKPSSKADFGTPEITYSSAENGKYTSKVPVNAGTWYVKASVKGTADYADGSAVKSFIIAKKALTVTAKAKSKNYGEADPELTYSTKGLLKDDKIKGSLKRTSGEKPGVYKINKGSVNAGNNYKMTFNGAEFKIKAVALISPLKVKAVNVTENSIDLTWSKVAGAEKYIVYGNTSGEGYDSIKIKTVKNNTLTIKKISGEKLEQAKAYKFRVTALDKSGMAIAKSVHVFVVTDGGKRGNPTSVKLVTPAKGEMTLKAGASFSIKAEAVLSAKKKPVNDGELRYESSNPKIAAVNGKGKVTAKKAGSCRIFVYASNGKMATVSVTVK